MSAVDLNEIDAGLDSTLRSVGKLLHKALNLSLGQFLGKGVGVVERDGAGADDVVGPSANILLSQSLVSSAANPRRQRARLAAGVGNLDADLGALAVDEVDNSLQRRNLRVLPQTGVLGRDAAAGLNGRGLDDDEAGAVKRQLAQVHQVVVSQVAIVGAVLAHGGHHNAVVQLEGADLDGLEQRRY